MAEELETMQPATEWDRSCHQLAIDRLRRHRDGLVVRVWGGDWCQDCRDVLPGLAAALEAADIPTDAIHQCAVEKAADGSKRGPRVEEYDITLIPTVVIERAGEEIARFEEDADRPAIAVLADQVEQYAQQSTQP